MTQGSTTLIKKNTSKLLQAIHDRKTTANYSNKINEAYTKWIKEFIIFKNKLGSQNQGKDEFKNLLKSEKINLNKKTETLLTI